MMSPQLTLSSLFCAAALASLCVVASVRDLTGTDTAMVPAPFGVQAALPPGLHD